MVSWSGIYDTPQLTAQCIEDWLECIKHSNNYAFTSLSAYPSEVVPISKDEDGAASIGEEDNDSRRTTGHVNAEG